MRNRTQYLILTALFTAFTAVGAFIKIPVGPTPISLQLFFIVLAGVLLGPWYGALSQILYVGLGLVGVPIFTSGGGFSYIFNPSFGYLLGFILVPIIVGLLTRRFGSNKFLPIFLSCIVAVLVDYCIGVPYMYMILHQVMNVDISIAKTFLTGFVIFIPGDLLKCILAGYLGKVLAPALRHTIPAQSAKEAA